MPKANRSFTSSESFLSLVNVVKIHFSKNIKECTGEKNKFLLAHASVMEVSRVSTHSLS